MNNIDFWFSIGSTYTYLTVMRLDDVIADTGITINWRPFSVRALMQEMNNTPFIGKPAKEQYMWRDVERRAQRYGIPLRLPIDYPLKHFDLANRIAVIAEQEGWCKEYVRKSYQLWFQRGLPPGDDSNLAGVMADLGQSLDRVIRLANTDSIEHAYREATSRARSLGIFGSPSFIVGERELFWGDDRLDDAIDFLRQHTTRS